MCACSKGQTNASSLVRKSQLYVLQEFPDCTEPYSGDEHRDLIYLIGQGTPHEQLMAPGNGKQAFAVAKSLGVGIARVPPYTLCAAAVEALFADAA